ncbi:MAG: isoprenoid biosynthesis glyoxalase ElbB [Candidatus Omnitrophica bacterium]|nr:isoprenoid biosynthesis glyoxalase ElbB [Candidatus Omnitrophota bacterium]
MNKRFAVILSGCGFQDGSEIHEATMSLLAIERTGNSYQCFAPDCDQHHVTNHLTGEPEEGNRNVLVESARIARGKVKALREYRQEDFDYLMLPGGYGAALNLCTFAVDGTECGIHPEVERAVTTTHAAGKPIGALCIAPVLLAKLLDEVKVTVGNDEDVNQALKAMGATPQNTKAEEIVVDEKKKLVTGPCYMLDSNIIEIANGAQNVVNALLRM